MHVDIQKVDMKNVVHSLAAIVVKISNARLSLHLSLLFF